MRDLLRAFPESWPLMPAKGLFKEVDNRSKSGEEKLLGLTKARGVVPRADIEQRASEAASYEGYKKCRPGDLILNKLQAWNGVLGLTPVVGIVSPDYTVFRPRREMAAKYYEYLFRTPLYVTEFVRESKGVGSGFNRLYTYAFGSIPCPYPDLGTQLGIVSFLDRETARIDLLIEKKRRLLDLLEEKRIALITRAVTQGLDPDVPMKDSGVSWIGEIPEHWEVVPLKFAASQIVDCLHSTPVYSQDGEYLAVRTADVDTGRLDTEGMRRVGEKEYRYRTQRLVPQARDILYSREGERYGHAALVPPGKRLCLAQRMMHLRASTLYVPEYLMWVMNSRTTYAQASLDTLGSTSPHVNVVTIRNFQIPRPPLNEQDKVAAHLDAETTRLTEIRTRVRAAADLLEEYRAAMISAVVTGKIDVARFAPA